MTDQTITLPKIERKHARLVLAGETPLICNKFSEAKIDKIEEKQQGRATKAKAPRDPEAEYLGSLYVIDQGAERYGFPGGGIKKAVVHGGGRFAGAKMTHLRGVLTIPADLVEIKGSKPRMRRDTTRLSKGVAGISYRAEFWPWEMTVPVIFNAGLITLEQVVNLFEHAGFEVGIGDWRNECNGIFGQFTVKEVQTI